MLINKNCDFILFLIFFYNDKVIINLVLNFKDFLDMQILTYFYLTYRYFKKKNLEKSNISIVKNNIKNNLE